MRDLRNEREANFAACQSGPCRQGRALCPSPDACRLPDDHGASAALLWLCIVLAVVVTVGAVFAVWP